MEVTMNNNVLLMVIALLGFIPHAECTYATRSKTKSHPEVSHVASQNNDRDTTIKRSRDTDVNHTTPKRTKTNSSTSITPPLSSTAIETPSLSPLTKTSNQVANTADIDISQVASIINAGENTDLVTRYSIVPQNRQSSLNNAAEAGNYYAFMYCIANIHNERINSPFQIILKKTNKHENDRNIMLFIIHSPNYWDNIGFSFNDIKTMLKEGTYLDMVYYFLKETCNNKKQDQILFSKNNEYNILHCAIVAGNSDFVAMIIAALDDEIISSLDKQVQHNNNPEMNKFTGLNPLFIAVQKNNSTIYKKILPYCNKEEMCIYNHEKLSLNQFIEKFHNPCIQSINVSNSKKKNNKENNNIVQLLDKKLGKYKTFEISPQHNLTETIITQITNSSSDKAALDGVLFIICKIGDDQMLNSNFSKILKSMIYYNYTKTFRFLLDYYGKIDDQFNNRNHTDLLIKTFENAYPLEAIEPLINDITVNSIKQNNSHDIVIHFILVLSNNYTDNNDAECAKVIDALLEKYNPQKNYLKQEQNNNNKKIITELIEKDHLKFIMKLVAKFDEKNYQSHINDINEGIVEFIKESIRTSNSLRAGLLDMLLRKPQENDPSLEKLKPWALSIYPIIVCELLDMDKSDFGFNRLTIPTPLSEYNNNAAKKAITAFLIVEISKLNLNDNIVMECLEQEICGTSIWSNLFGNNKPVNQDLNKIAMLAKESQVIKNLLVSLITRNIHLSQLSDKEKATLQDELTNRSGWLKPSLPQYINILIDKAHKTGINLELLQTLGLNQVTQTTA